MTGGPDWRRILPPPPRRPGPFAILVRWRVELLAMTAIAVLWHDGGTVAVEWVGGGAALLLLVGGPRTMIMVWQLFAVPHRVRAAFFQAGVATRRGRLPWVFGAWPRRGAVAVAVGLRPGIILRDLHDAAPVICSSCGATGVEITSRPGRPDRARIMVVHPRRGVL